MKKIILASKSPRRIELLASYGVDAVSVASDVDESIPEDIKEPQRIVEYLSEKKALSVFDKCKGGEIVIAADTLVFCGEEILGKPENIDDARRMMKLLSDNTHSVITGMCIVSPERKITDSTITNVLFKKLSDEEVEEYIRTKDPYDKAGGYGIQSLGGKFVREIHGDYYNVVGLPISKLLEILKNEFGYSATVGEIK